MTLVIALNVAFWWPLIGLVLGSLPSKGNPIMKPICGTSIRKWLFVLVQSDKE